MKTRLLTSAAAVLQLFHDIACNHPRDWPRLVRDFWKWATIDDKAAVVLLCAGCGATGAGVARFGTSGGDGASPAAAATVRRGQGKPRTIRYPRRITHLCDGGARCRRYEANPGAYILIPRHRHIGASDGANGR